MHIHVYLHGQYIHEKCIKTQTIITTIRKHRVHAAQPQATAQAEAGKSGQTERTLTWEIKSPESLVARDARCGVHGHGCARVRAAVHVRRSGPFVARWLLRLARVGRGGDIASDRRSLVFMFDILACVCVNGKHSTVLIPC